MNTLDSIERILSTNLINYNLKYCLVSENKIPFKTNGEVLRPNHTEDFSTLDELINSTELENFAGIGISIQGSNICAIDVDKCFSIPNVISSADDRAKTILEKFKDIAYCEFSFSGTGLRIIFKGEMVDNYSNEFYTKNKTNSIEYYQPSSSYRYVTLTGNYIYDSEDKVTKDDIFWFLNKYMSKPKKIKNIVTRASEISLDECRKKLKYLYLTNFKFQDLWFSNAPGSGKDESERDFKIIINLYECITQDPNLIKQLFEESPYFKSKDEKHLNKWKYGENRYFKYIFSQIERLV